MIDGREIESPLPSPALSPTIIPEVICRYLKALIFDILLFRMPLKIV